MNQKTKRILMSICGVVICGFSVGIFKLAALGVDPFQTLMSGLDQLIPVSFGTLYVIVNLILLCFSLLVDRHYIGLATFINLFLLGYITQFTYEFFQGLFPDPSLWFRAVCLIIAIVIICFASSLYMTADLGVSTYDAVALICTYKWKLGQFKYVRITTDVICVVLGTVIFLIGGGAAADIPTLVGIGTIITAFFMGPLIDFFNRKVSLPFLERSSR